MAGRMEAKIAALLSLLVAILIAHTLLLQPPGPRATVVFFSDRLLSALRFDGRQLVDLINRRNMILLCNAILLIILRDAGLLAAPARRRSSAATAAGGEDGCCQAQPKPKSTVEAWRSSTAAAGTSDAKCAVVAGDGRAQQRERRRGPEPDKTTARLRRVKPSSAGAAHKEYPLARQIHPQRQTSEPAAHDERSRGKEMARQETQGECVDDMDEMNKKFEEFIASMRRMMQLESRQLVKV
ncbi:unnamed protein product [Alopecurus aequalis]